MFKTINKLTPRIRQRAITIVSIIDSIFNLFIGIVKIIIAILSGSIAIASDSILNFGDTLSGIVTLIGLKLSSHKPTEKHPFGFGRFEYFTTIIAAVIMITVSSVFAHISWEHIIYPVEINITDLEFIILFLMVFLKYFLYYFNKRYYEKTDCGPIESIEHDSLIDAIGTTFTISLIFFDRYIHLNLDGFIGLGVALFIIISSCVDIYKTINLMLGVNTDKELIKEIRKTVLNFKEVKGVRNIIIHSYGYNVHYGQMDLILDKNMNTEEISKLFKDLDIKLNNLYNTSFSYGILPT